MGDGDGVGRDEIGSLVEVDLGVEKFFKMGVSIRDRPL